MNSALRDRLAKAKRALAADPRHGRVAGEIGEPAGIPGDETLRGWETYRDFLRVADGASLGVADLWSYQDLPKKQHIAVDLPGQAKTWLVVGQLLYEPLAMERDTGIVRLFRRDGDPLGEQIGDFDDLMGRLLGPGYALLVPDAEDDEWWSLLETAGLR